MRRSPPIRPPRRLAANFRAVSGTSEALILLGALLAVSLTTSAPGQDVAPPIVFVERHFDGGDDDGSERPSAVDRAVEGRLMLRTTDGAVEPLVDASLEGAPAETPRDVSDPDVSFDGERIVFSGYSEGEGAWRIYEVGASGTGLRQITRSDRRLDLARYGAAAGGFQSYDDVDPCYLPDGRICFVSTRYPEAAPEGRLRATNLYVVNADGSGLHRITTERFGGDTPAVNPTTGEIVYSRWWRTALTGEGGSLGAGSGVDTDIPEHPDTEPPPPPPPPPIPPGGYYSPDPPAPPPPDIRGSSPDFASAPSRGIDDGDFTGVNSWFLASMRPDGSGMTMFSGFHLNREITQAYRPSFFPDGNALAVFINSTPFLGRPGTWGLRRFQPGPGTPEELGGPQTFRPAPTRFLYHSAEPLPDGGILVSGRRPGDAHYDVFIQREFEAPVRLFGREGRHELDAVAVVSRPRPPVLGDRASAIAEMESPSTLDEAIAQNGTFTFKVANIFANAPVNVPIPNAPPVGQRLFIEFYMAPQGTTVHPEPPVLLDRQELTPDGRIEVEAPAGVPLFEVLRRADGSLAVGRDGQVFHVGGLNFGSPGATGLCVGCHAGHSMMDITPDPSWTNLAPSALVSASSSRGQSANAAASNGVFRPEVLVDRRTSRNSSEWAADPADRTPEIDLRWSIPITARQATLYAPEHRSNSVVTTDQVITSYRVRTYLAGELQDDVRRREPLAAEGTRVALNPALPFDRLNVEIRDFHGVFENGTGAALAEIEVIARAVPGATPTLTMVRGDADCSNDVWLNLSDAVTILNGLFRGGSFCCEAAADVNDDAEINLTDGVHILKHLFRGGHELPAPWPYCGTTPVEAFTCDEAFCSPTH